MSAQKVNRNNAAMDTDNLLLIKGIGPVNERKLREHGVTSFTQIAGWKKADIVAVEKYLEFDGRIAREDWIGQAKTLGKSAKAKVAAKPSVAAAKASKAKAAPKSAAAIKAAVGVKSSAKPSSARAATAKTKAVTNPLSAAEMAARPAAKAATTPASAPAAASKAKTAAMPVAAAKAPRAVKSATKRAAKAKPSAKSAAAVSAPVAAAVAVAPAVTPAETRTPILQARGLTKKYGQVIALNQADFDLYSGEILGVIGDNGAGKSTLIKALSGAVTPDHGEIRLDGQVVHFKSPQDGRAAGIETVYQNLALSPALSIAENMFLGREIKKAGPMGQWFRLTDRSAMQKFAREKLSELGLMTIQNINQPVETLSGGQRQGVAVARAAAFGSKVVIMDEPTAALGVKESRRVLELIRDVKKRGMPIILISHNMPHVFEVCDRIHIHRLGARLCTIKPKDFTMSDAVAFMTGAKMPPQESMAV